MTALDDAPSATMTTPAEPMSGGYPSFLSPRHYFDPEVFDAERARVFPRVWQLVGETGQLVAPGDYLTDEVSGQPVVVIRDDAGALRCFANVCRHRGCTLLEGAGNTGSRLVCPYHNWSYDLDGVLRGIPHRAEFEFNVEFGKLGLVEIRLATWERLVFVDFSGDAPPIDEYFAGIPADVYSHRITDMRPISFLEEELPGNWKTHVDNAFCAYHFAMVHPDTLEVNHERSGWTTQLTDWIGATHIPWKGFGETNPVAPQLTGLASTGSINIALFPNVFIGLLPIGRFVVLEWSPIAVDRTRIRAWSFGHGDDIDVDAEAAYNRYILEQDWAVVRRTEQGMRSPLYPGPGPRHLREARVGGFHRRLLALLG